MRWGHQIACGIMWTVGAAAHADEFSVAAGYYATEQWRQAFVAFDRLLQFAPDHPQRPDAEFFSAESAAQLGDFDTAGKRFADFLARYPNHSLATRAAFRVGESRYLAGDRKGAIPLLQQFVAQYPQHELNEYALGYLGLALAEASDRAAARRWLDASLERYPRGSMARQVADRLLELDYEQQNVSGLRATLNRLARIDPQRESDAQWHLWLGRLLHLSGQPSAALREFERAIADDTGEQVKSRGLYEAARLHLAQGDTASTLAKLTALAGLTTTTSTQWVEWSYWQRIRILAEQQRTSEASSLATEFGRRFPQSKYLRDVQPLVAQWRAESGAERRAMEVLEDLAAEAAGSGEIPSAIERAVRRYQLARARYESGDYAGALSVLEPVDTGSLPSAVAGRIDYARASSHQQLQQFDEALSALDRATASTPSASFAARIRWKRIGLRTQAGQWDAALADLQNWEPSGDEAIWYYRQAGRQLAETAFAAGQYEQACTAFALLVAHLTGPPDMAHGLAGMAWCYLRQQNWATAAGLFQRLADQFPTSAQVPAALFAQAYSLESLNDLQAATQAYCRIIERFPGSPDRWRAELKVAELLQKQQDLHAAAAVLEAGLEAAVDDRVRNRLRYQLAMVRRELGQDEASRQLLQVLADEGPGGEFWADANYRLAREALTQGDPETAERLLDELLAAGANDRASELAPYGTYLRARAAAQRGDWQAVLSYLDNLQVAYPASDLVTAAKVWSIEALYRLGDYQNVRHRIRSMAESQVQLTPDWQRLIDLRDAQALAETGKAQEAIDRVRSLADGPLHDQYWAEANAMTGHCEVRLGRYLRAYELLRQVIDDPLPLDRETHNACWSGIGDVFLAQGDYERALDAYLRVRPHRDSSWYATALMGAAEALEKLGRREEALPVLRRLANSHLNTLDRTRAQEMIERWGEIGDDAAEPQIPVSATSPR